MNKVCFVSIDVERSVENLDKILDIFKKYNLPATLFTTGYVLERYPERVLSWSRDFEIACHTFTHRYWDTISQEERETELEKFNKLYGQMFNRKPAGFRVPSHIIDESGLKLLENKGFLYDSSIVPHYPPFKRYRGYQGKAPLVPYYPDEQNCRQKGKMRILEIPAAGGLFGLPLVGVWIIKLPFFIFKISLGIYQPPFITLSMHPWDNLKTRFLRNLERMVKLLKSKNYQFANGREIYASISKNK